MSLAQLAKETGFVTRSLQYIRTSEPGVLFTRERSGKTEYKQPDCAQNLFKREREIAKREAKSTSFEQARARKTLAEAQIAEHDLADREGRSIPTDVHETRLRERLESVAGAVKAMHRFDADIVAVTDDRQAHALVDNMIDFTLAELYGLSEEIE